MQKYSLSDLRAAFEPRALAAPNVRQRSFVQVGVHRGIPVYRDTTPRKEGKSYPVKGVQEAARRVARGW